MISFKIDSNDSSAWYDWIYDTLAIMAGIQSNTTAVMLNEGLTMLMNDRNDDLYQKFDKQISMCKDATIMPVVFLPDAFVIFFINVLNLKLAVKSVI